PDEEMVRTERRGPLGLRNELDEHQHVHDAQHLQPAGRMVPLADLCSALEGTTLSPGCMPAAAIDRKEERMSMSDQAQKDAAHLEKFGYKQELKRELGTFSSFAIALAYISPSTGIFTLFFLGVAALGGVLWWTWPLVALMQFIVALNFAELSSHFPVAGSVYQWTKYLSGRTHS